MNKVKTKKQKTKNVVELPVVNPYSAGIDIGDTLDVVVVAEGLSAERVRSFGTMTSDLTAIADWLDECEIDTVAMESTGVYWKPLFSLLSSRGFEVYLVNAAHAKNITGRKDDENDAMWIQKRGYKNFTVVACLAVRICRKMNRKRFAPLCGFEEY